MSGDVATGPGWELRLGRYQEALADVGEVSAVICDPPYGERTHGGQRHGRRESRRGQVGQWCSTRGLPYAAWGPEDAAGLVAAWANIPGWMVILTEHGLCSVFESAFEAHNRTRFAPVACVTYGMNVRLAGDGPSNWTVYAMVSRPKSLKAWGTLPGAYVGTQGPRGQGFSREAYAVPGGKPLWLMRALIRDYTRPGDLVCDPCAGGGTTLLAAVMEGRRAIGAEMDPETFALAAERLHAEANFRVMDVDDRGVPRMKQQSLDLGESA